MKRISENGVLQPTVAALVRQKQLWRILCVRRRNLVTHIRSCWRYWVTSNRSYNNRKRKRKLECTVFRHYLTNHMAQSVEGEYVVRHKQVPGTFW